MVNRPRLRLIVALAIALCAVGTLAAPAAAETILVNCNGTCGSYQYGDTGPIGGKGAVCEYETGSSFDLDFISVRPPLMHGPNAYQTPVEWRYRIWRAPVTTGVFTVRYKSTWQKAKADDAIPAYADHGFARRYWYASEDPHGWFKVRVYLRWKNNAGTVIGTASAEYDWYKTERGASSNTATQYCLEEY